MKFMESSQERYVDKVTGKELFQPAVNLEQVNTVQKGTNRAISPKIVFVMASGEKVVWHYDRLDTCDYDYSRIVGGSLTGSLAEGALTEVELSVNTNKTPAEHLAEIAHLLPHVVLVDVAKRMRDWEESGGKDDDPYMQGQLEYAKRFIDKGDE